MGTGLTSGFRLDAWSCRPVSCCSSQVVLACGGTLAAVSVVPQHYVADDRRLLRSAALTFGAVNEVAAGGGPAA
jgi:hypothetical protein